VPPGRFVILSSANSRWTALLSRDRKILAREESNDKESQGESQPKRRAFSRWPPPDREKWMSPCNCCTCPCVRPGE